MKQLNRSLEILAGVAAVILLTSLIVEVGLQQLPCLMCQLERGVYMVFIACISLGIGRQKQNLWLGAIMITLIIGICLAVYHTLLQLGFAPSFCVRLNKAIESKDDFLQLLSSPSCAERSWDIFGIPASAYNGAIFLSLLAWIFYQKKVYYFLTFMTPDSDADE